MPLVHRLCLCLSVVPVIASAPFSAAGDSVTMDHFDCLINPAISGLVSCLPPEDHTVREYRWEMGDGAVYTSEGSKPYIYHTYKEPGEYTVTLTTNRAETTSTSQSVLSVPEPREDGASSQLARGHFR